MADSRDRDAVEMVSALLLAAATAASAWCAYQSTLWNGEQIRALAVADTAHFEALRKSSSANMDMIIDVNTLLGFLQSEADGKPQVGDFLRKHARPEFRPAFEDWVAQTRAGNVDVSLPFKSPRYRIGATTEADALQEKAAAATRAGNEANEHSDLFVLHTVLFALGLFFLGWSGQGRGRLVRLTMLGLGSLVLTLAMISMLRIPRAPHTWRPSGAPEAESAG